ncbi:MAG TPA: hypothetical protein VH597_17445 [Verrucomicrobiae bacterium]|jgi:hypothetical protein|nr:hypothetical protein [Verrucomicrobiae bacterium]
MPTEPFLPLIPTVPASHGERTDFQATVISQPGQMQKFSAVESSAAQAGPGAAARGSDCEPRVTVQRDGDRVTAIHIQCSCGKVIDLACVYQG